VSQQVRLDRFEEWFIRRKAWELVNQAGFPVEDVEDVQQDMRLAVLQRLLRFDRDKSVRHTFIVRVVRCCAATILKRHSAAKRNGGRRLQSLNDTVHDADGYEVELHETISNDARHSGDSDREREDRRDLVADVRCVVASLPDDLRAWCGVFAELGICEASRKFHVPLSRLRRIKADLRAAFQAAGLEDYLPTK